MSEAQLTAFSTGLLVALWRASWQGGLAIGALYALCRPAGSALPTFREPALLALAGGLPQTAAGFDERGGSDACGSAHTANAALRTRPLTRRRGDTRAESRLPFSGKPFPSRIPVVPWRQAGRRRRSARYVPGECGSRGCICWASESTWSASRRRDGGRAAFCATRPSSA